MEEFGFDMNLHAFKRRDNGTPDYSQGFWNLNLRFALTMELQIPKSFSMLQEEAGRAARVTIDTYLRQEEQKFARAVLVDNDDQFLRNMIPPHNHQLMNGMFTDDYPVLFTPDVAPPPIRLNFPFLVGRNEKDLVGDLRRMLDSYFNANMPNINVIYDDKNFKPIETVTVEKVFESLTVDRL